MTDIFAIGIGDWLRAFGIVGVAVAVWAFGYLMGYDHGHRNGALAELKRRILDREKSVRCD